MKQLFEYTDKLNTPYECFACSNLLHSLPVSPHFHFFIEILYMRKGNMLIKYEDDSYILSEGDLIIFPPSSVHAMYATSHAPFRYDVLKFDPSFLTTRSKNGAGLTINWSALFASLKKNASAEIYFPAETLSPFSIPSLFDTCLMEMEQKQYGYQTLLHAKIQELFTYLLRIWRADGFDTDILHTPARDEESIYSITEYIDMHAGENLRVADLAELCHMSYSYFAKSFREIYGQSCKKYIESLRLSKVEDMLLFTSFDLNYISQETGFSDCSHLIHAFKERYNITPHQFRQHRPIH